MYHPDQLQELFLHYLKTQSFDQKPPELYEPVNYIMNLGGKRLRPVLLLMGCNLYHESVEQALPAAFAIEIFHNFSLVHDDIMDKAPLRRGKDTVHIKYGQNAGILSGDVMLILTYQYLGNTDPVLLPALLPILNQLAIEVCEGQQYDMNFETAMEVSIPDYLRMIELKTSVLIAGALEMGALIGGARAEAAKKLYGFGRNIGIAFQLQDDILDTFGDPEKFGKKPGGDIIQNKKTFLLLKTLELANQSQKEELLNFINMSDFDEKMKVEGVINLYKQLGVRQLAEQLMENYLKTAFNFLDELDIKEDRKLPLKKLANQLMMREI